MNGTDLFAGTIGGGLFYSTNYGVNWSKLNNGIPFNAQIYSMIIDGLEIYAASQGSGVFYSTNYGTNWTPVNNGLTNLNVYALAKRESYLLAGTGGGMFISTDKGSNWAEINNGLTDLNIRSIAIKGDTIFAGAIMGIFYSTNNGANWNVSYTPGNPANSIIVNEHNLFAGFSIRGVIVSTNGGLNWSYVNTGLADQNVRSLFIKDSYLYAGTDFNGVWRRPLSEIITDVYEKPISSPEDFALFQNYPNPFNPSTKISWQSPVGGHQTLKVYDVLGNEIATLVDGYYEAGNHSTFYIVNSKLSSGVYFYQLRAGNPSTSSGQGFVETKKMILLK